MFSTLSCETDLCVGKKREADHNFISASEKSTHTSLQNILLSQLFNLCVFPSSHSGRSHSST